eukprot:4386922-Alexandrium_andersonii.AAC.1
MGRTRSSCHPGCQRQRTSAARRAECATLELHTCRKQQDALFGNMNARYPDRWLKLSSSLAGLGLCGGDDGPGE